MTTEQTTGEAASVSSTPLLSVVCSYCGCSLRYDGDIGEAIINQVHIIACKKCTPKMITEANQAGWNGHVG